MADQSKMEIEWLSKNGFHGWGCALDFVDNTGADFQAIPDAIFIGITSPDLSDPVTLYFVDYKGGQALNADGARKGREAAERRKREYLDNAYGNKAQRYQYAISHLGWNHSIYQKQALIDSWSGSGFDVRCVIVDPALNKATGDKLKNLRKWRGKHKDVLFMTPTKFNDFIASKCLIEAPDVFEHIKQSAQSALKNQLYI